MKQADAGAANVRQVVPFLGITDIESSLRFYVAGLGFSMARQWAPEGRIRWCWLDLGGASLMLQEYWKDGKPGGAPGPRRIDLLHVRRRHRGLPECQHVDNYPAEK